MQAKNGLPVERIEAPCICDGCNEIVGLDDLRGEGTDLLCPDCHYETAHKMGRCCNGFESDSGRLIHAIRGVRALCGTTPGKRSAGWSFHDRRKEVTCRKCADRIAK